MSSNRLLRLFKRHDRAGPVVVASAGGSEWIVCELDADGVLGYPLDKNEVIDTVGGLMPGDDASGANPWSAAHETAHPPTGPPGTSSPSGVASGVGSGVGSATARATALGGADQSVPSVLRAMARVAADSFTLADIADMTAAAAADSVGGQGCAVLVPDGDTWRVTGSFGLRPTETRLTLAHDHWLVQDLMKNWRGAIIDNTDVARARLVNAPLAAHDQLLVASELATGTVLMVGRQTEVFTEDDLSAARAVLSEAAAPLAEALAVRRLARDLLRFVDIADF